MTQFWLAEARALDGEDGVWSTSFDAYSIEDAAVEASDWARGIFRPASMRLVVRVFGPFEYEWENYEQERYI